jgi:tellurite resistance protein TerC
VEWLTTPLGAEVAVGVGSVGTPVLWGGFIVFVLAMLALDLGIFHSKAHVVRVKEALLWRGV